MVNSLSLWNPEGEVPWSLSCLVTSYGSELLFLINSVFLCILLNRILHCIVWKKKKSTFSFFPLEFQTFCNLHLAVKLCSVSLVMHGACGQGYFFLLVLGIISWLNYFWTTTTQPHLQPEHFSFHLSVSLISSAAQPGLCLEWVGIVLKTFKSFVTLIWTDPPMLCDLNSVYM